VLAVGGLDPLLPPLYSRVSAAESGLESDGHLQPVARLPDAAYNPATSGRPDRPEQTDDFG
jgi:hypothetical protein